MDSILLQTVRGWLREASQVAVLTGAGISAESGVPTFRDAQTGYWAQFRAEDMATEEGFRAHPERVWGWYMHRRQLMAGVQPNAGHTALADFAQRHPGRLTLITQNVDGLHQRAGSQGVLCLHGDLMEDRFLDMPRACCHPDTVEAGTPPHCPRCGNLRRPGVVWFGEALPEAVFAAAQQAARACNLMLVVGTAGVVYPAAGLAHSARAAGARVVVVNTAASELDGVAHAVLHGGAAQVLPALLAL
jgi:NAD-dependent deacetylase